MEKLENIIGNENESTVVSLKFIGKPKPNIKFFKDEEEFDFKNPEIFEFFETEDIYSLKFKQLCNSNVGTYCVELFNKAGSYKSNKFQIIVNRKSI